MSVITNGGFAEYLAINEKNVFLLPSSINWEVAASLPVAALTSYHALKEARITPSETVVVIGASGNTGMFAVQLAKMMGANVIAVSKKNWLNEFGADYVLDYTDLENKIKEITYGKMADVVINSLGQEYWELSLKLVGTLGRIVTFGMLTGGEIKGNLATIYSKHVQILGVTGGTRSEMLELLKISNKLKVKVWKKYNLEEGITAIKEIMSRDREGRILINV